MDTAILPDDLAPRRTLNLLNWDGVEDHTPLGEVLAANRRVSAILEMVTMVRAAPLCDYDEETLDALAEEGAHLAHALAARALDLVAETGR